MLLHDFIYTWDGTSKHGEKPISWWPGSYHVKIVKPSPDTGNISALFPHVVILKNAQKNPPAKNTSLKNYIHTFAGKISTKYELDMEKTLWVELDNGIRVIRFPKDSNAIPRTLFSVSWREIRPNELEMIKPYIDDM